VLLLRHAGCWLMVRISVQQSLCHADDISRGRHWPASAPLVPEQ
jgi:hypothetical protein